MSGAELVDEALRVLRTWNFNMVSGVPNQTEMLRIASVPLLNVPSEAKRVGPPYQPLSEERLFRWFVYGYIAGARRAGKSNES